MIQSYRSHQQNPYNTAKQSSEVQLPLSSKQQQQNNNFTMESYDKNNYYSKNFKKGSSHCNGLSQPSNYDNDEVFSTTNNQNHPVATCKRAGGSGDMSATTIQGVLAATPAATRANRESKYAKSNAPPKPIRPSTSSNFSTADASCGSEQLLKASKAHKITRLLPTETGTMKLAQLQTKTSKADQNYEESASNRSHSYYRKNSAPVTGYGLASGSSYGVQAHLENDRKQAQAVDRIPEPVPFSNNSSTLSRTQKPSQQRQHLRSAFSEVNLHTENQPSVVRKTMLSDQEVQQAALMYKGNGSQVHVCGCLANLYLKSALAIKSSSKNDAEFDNWVLERTGIPVLVLNLGASNCRSQRQLELIIAERGTGFLLWRDRIDKHSNVTEVQQTFHTLSVSDDHTRLAGLSYDHPYAAVTFFAKLQELISDPQNVALAQTMSGSLSKAKARKRSSIGATARKILLMKNQISTPCCF